MLEKFQKQLSKSLNSLYLKKHKTFSKLARSRHIEKYLVVVNSTYVPEELVLAFNKVPVHISEIDEGDFDKVAFFIYCEKGTGTDKQEEKLLKGVKKENTFSFKQVKEKSERSYSASIVKLIEFLEDRCHSKLTEKKLLEATKLMNECRYILSRFAEIRRVNNSFLDLETWEELIHYSWVLPREVFNKAAKKALKHVNYVPLRLEKSANFVLCSSGEREHELKKYIEESGASICCDIESKDFRRFNKMVPEKAPILKTLIKIYFSQYPSILFTKEHDRSKSIEEFVKKYDASGVIYCIPPENNHYDKEIELLKKHGIAIIVLKLNGVASQIKDLLDLTFVKHSTPGS